MTSSLCSMWWKGNGRVLQVSALGREPGAVHSRVLACALLATAPVEEEDRF